MVVTFVHIIWSVKHLHLSADQSASETREKGCIRMEVFSLVHFFAWPGGKDSSRSMLEGNHSYTMDGSTQ